MGKYTSFLPFRALRSPAGNPALLRFSRSRQGFFALTERLNLVGRTLASTNYLLVLTATDTHDCTPVEGLLCVI